MDRGGGSSPQARGALNPGLGVGEHRRLIPAGAGSTAALSRPEVGRAGSSPQARGALPGRGAARRHGRLIPAGAGSTRRWKPPPSSARAHPRRRGEHTVILVSPLSDQGSSPQARGARARDPARRIRGRLIPAGAGSTAWPRTTRLPCGAHPRRRGEHRQLQLHLPVHRGSSPQARGAQPKTYRKKPVTGLIPAGAGSTADPHQACPSPPAHPRRRGEHFKAGLGLLKDAGSSPQARGALDVVALPEVVDRLIPAGAGSTPRPWS